MSYSCNWNISSGRDTQDVAWQILLSGRKASRGGTSWNTKKSAQERNKFT